MSEHSTLSSNLGDLRKLAEQVVSEKKENADLSHATMQTQKLLHELQVHHVELEMQNEELKRTQHELETSKSRYFELYDLAPTGYMTVNEDGIISEANLSTSKLLGLPRNKLISQPFNRFILPEERNFFHTQFKQLTGSETPRSQDMRLVTAAGSTIWVNLKCVFSPNDEYWITLDDITGRKRVEEAIRMLNTELHESEERLRFALENSHTGAWDLDLIDHSAVRTLEHDQIFGYPELLPEWTYEMFLEHVLPESREMVNGIFQQAIENQSDWHFECRIQRNDGQIRWIRGAGRQLYDGKGVPIRSTGIVQDITERKIIEEKFRLMNQELEERVAKRTAALANANNQLRREVAEREKTEEALRRSNEEWQNTFNASSDPIFLLDRDHHIMRANLATLAMTGISAEEIIGRACHEIIHGTNAPADHCPQCLVLEDLQSHTEEIFVKKMDKYFLVTVSPIFDSANAHVGSIHYVKDITTIKLAEQALANAKIDLERKVIERTSELAEANDQMKKVSFELIWAEEKERERIAGELHDRVGQSLLLAKMKLDALEEQLRDDALQGEAASASALLGASIQDIRSLTFRMRPPILDTAGIETTLKWLCSSISSDYNLQVDFSDDVRPKPLSTETRYVLYQAVRELLLNVVKHSGSSKSQLSITTDDRMFVVNVKDEGVGFTQADGIMKHVHNGGYGLYNVRQRVEQLGGDFSVESLPGSGTSVTLAVPLDEQ